MKILLLVGAAVIVVIVSSQTPENEAKWAAEALLKSSLIDPDSAKIGKTIFVKGNVCGTVNAKNRLGGYTGDQPFIVSGWNGRRFDGVDIGAVAAHNWARDCQS